MSFLPLRWRQTAREDLARIVDQRLGRFWYLRHTDGGAINDENARAVNIEARIERRVVLLVGEARKLRDYGPGPRIRDRDVAAEVHRQTSVGAVPLPIAAVIEIMLECWSQPFVVGWCNFPKRLRVEDSNGFAGLRPQQGTVPAEDHPVDRATEVGDRWSDRVAGRSVPEPHASIR